MAGWALRIFFTLAKIYILIRHKTRLVFLCVYPSIRAAIKMYLITKDDESINYDDDYEYRVALPNKTKQTRINKLSSF